MVLDDDPITICSLQLDDATDAAICVDGHWLAVSLVISMTTLENGKVDIVIPYWLAKREELL